MSDQENDFVPGQIYAVHAKHLDRNVLLGYCFAESEEDIRAFYDEDKAYGIVITAVLPVRIPTGYAEQRAALIEQRNNLQKQINELNMQISRRLTK